MEKTQLTKTEDRKLKMSDTNPQPKTVDEVFRKGRNIGSTYQNLENCNKLFRELFRNRVIDWLVGWITATLAIFKLGRCVNNIKTI